MKSAICVKQTGWSGRACAYGLTNVAIWKRTLRVFGFGRFMRKDHARNGCCCTVPPLFTRKMNMDGGVLPVHIHFPKAVGAGDLPAKGVLPARNLREASQAESVERKG